MIPGTEQGGEMTEESKVKLPPLLDDPDLKLSDRLALRRTLLSADRTLLSWVRTAIAFIGFGFTIYKVFDTIYSEGLIEAVRPQTPRNFGMFLILTGTVSLFFIIIEYVRAQRTIGLELQRILAKPALWVACAICLLGLTLFLMVLLAQPTVSGRQ
jgi:putative membrane protein